MQNQSSLRALEQELSQDDDTRTAPPSDIRHRPEVRLALESAESIARLLIRGDEVAFERDTFEKRALAAEGEVERLRAEMCHMKAHYEGELLQATSERDYFEAAFIEARDDLEAIDRLATHSTNRVRQQFAKRPKIAEAGPKPPVVPQDDDIPAFLREGPRTETAIPGRPVGPSRVVALDGRRDGIIPRAPSMRRPTGG